MNKYKNLVEFRNKMYNVSFNKRKDAVMNLLDAISSYGHRCKSVVELSNSSYFARQYSSITDAISDGLETIDWRKTMELVFKSVMPNVTQKRFLFFTDCTPQPRPYSKTLDDKTITHLPNPAPGNKPICVGHQYSTLALSPQSETNDDWLVPLDVQRVTSNEKGQEVGMKQILDCIDSLSLTELVVTVGDSLYGTEKCRKTLLKKDNWTHVFRLNSTRNVYLKNNKNNTNGRKKVYGCKMKLNDPSTHTEPNEQTTINITTHKGKECVVTISLWNDLIVRGSKDFKSYKHAFNVIRINVTDKKTSKDIFKRPLWLGIAGKRRNEISLADAYNYYTARYNIEKMFRFGKRNLLLNSFQTPEVKHEELWWRFGMLAYNQLYLSKEIVPLLPKPWERYLPKYKKTGNVKIATPSQTQRGMEYVLGKTGTPARACVSRGKASGRKAGELQIKRDIKPIIFKTKKTGKKKNFLVSSESGKTNNISQPEKINSLLALVNNELSKSNFSAQEFAKMILDTS
jgi:hypothetical protein